MCSSASPYELADSTMDNTAGCMHPTCAHLAFWLAMQPASNKLAAWRAAAWRLLRSDLINVNQRSRTGAKTWLILGVD